jgi:uncharacterized protein
MKEDKMKKHSVLIALVLGFLLSTGPIMAQCSCEKQDDRGTLSVSSSASQNYPPDTAVITLAVETQAKTAAEAASINAKKASDMISKINSIINKKAGDSVQTTQYSINPVYEYNESQRKSYLTGYRVTNGITVTIKQLNLVSKIIDASIASGANQVQGINFIIDKNEEYYKSLLTQAAKKAKDEAATVAQALGVNIVGIKQISTGSNVPPPRVMYNKGMMMAAEAASTPIEAGEVDVNASVNIDFYIK